MNIFIDFDHTLYNTPLLTVDMLNALASYISKNSFKNFNDILQELKDKFKRGKDNIYDIYKLVEHFSTIYNFLDASNSFMLSYSSFIVGDASPGFIIPKFELLETMNSPMLCTYSTVSYFKLITSLFVVYRSPCIFKWGWK